MFEEAGSKAANQQLLKQMNKALLRNLIYSSGPVSRSQLAKITSLSPTTVSSLVSELIGRNMVMETGTVKSGSAGRKPMMLRINPGGGYVAAFEMTESLFVFNIYDLECKPVYESQNLLSSYSDADMRMKDILVKAAGETGITGDMLIGIVIGVPALIDRDKSRIITSTVMPLGEDKDLVGKIRGKFPGVPVVLENSSCLYAYAEKSFGRNRDVGDLVFIDIGTGVGSGIIIDGRLFSGSSGKAGEIGHICIDPNGPVCKCGNRGCFETMASIPAIKREVMAALISGRPTMLQDQVNGNLNNMTLEIIRHALDNGDALVREIAEDISGIIAAGINNVINFLDPEVVVIGGEILKLGHYFMERVIGDIEKMKLKPVSEKPSVVFTDIQKDPVCLGGAKYVLDMYFRGSTA